MEEIIHQTEHHLRIEDQHTLFVGGIYLVGTGNHRTHLIGNALHRDARQHGHTDHTHLFTIVVGLLHHRQRDIYRLLTTAVDADISRTVVNPHHLIIYIVDGDLLSAGITSLREQRLIDLLSDDTYLTMLTYIHLIEVSAIEDLRTLHLLIIG